MKKHSVEQVDRYREEKESFIKAFDVVSIHESVENECRTLIAQLKAEKTWLLTLINSISDEIWFADPQKQIILANKAAMKEFSFSGAASIDMQHFFQNLESHYSDDSVRPVAETPPLFKALAGEHVRNHEEIAHAPDSNAVCYRQINASPVKGENSEIIGAIAVVHDITELKKTQKRISESEEYLRTIMSAVVDNIMMLDSAGTILFVNHLPSGSRLKQVVGSNWLEWLEPADRPVAKDAINKALAEKESTTIELHVSGPLPKKTLFQVKFSYSLLLDGDPQVAMVARDITERKQIEEKLLTVQKLESLGVLAGGIAHDFNNLLSGILGCIELAKENSKDRAVTSLLLNALSTIDRARALTGQLLTFAKGGVPLQKVGNLFPFVQETAKFALSGATISINFDVSQDLWVCSFDKNQIGQVIDNLIINAQQAMPEGGKIELSAKNITLLEREHPILKKGNYVKIAIKDHGTGIAKELITRIFDPFFTTKSKGHGLGLATCYSIIKKHEGCIDVDSEPGKGSLFCIYLPASYEKAPDFSEQSTKMHQGTGTFLIMDDEDIVRETIRWMLSSFGYSVVCKRNGNDAIDFLKAETKANRKISGMIFDLTIPGGMGGLSAITEIRKFDMEIPVFVASGYIDDLVMKLPAKYGFTAKICKPFRKVELSELLNQYITVQK